MERNDCNHEHGKCCHRSIWKCICWGLLGVVGFIAVVALLGFAIMHLWNWLMPLLFKLPVITYWQGIGLAVLSRLLFGGCGRGFRHMRGMHHKHGHGHRHGHCCESEKECCSDKKQENQSGDNESSQKM